MKRKMNKAVVAALLSSGFFLTAFSAVHSDDSPNTAFIPAILMLLGGDQPYSRGIYVSTSDTAAVDDSACGTRSPAGMHPCKTITYGIARAVDMNQNEIYVAAGSYDETVTLVPGKNLFGGYNPTTWERDTDVNRTLIFGNTTENNKKTVIADGITTSSTTMDGFAIYGQNAFDSQHNSYAVWIHDSGSVLTLSNNVIIGGDGSPGMDGANGPNGTNGPDGDDGRDAYEPAGEYGCAESCPASAANPGGNGGQNICGGINVSGGTGGLADCPDYDEGTDMCVSCGSLDNQTVTSSGSEAPNGGGSGGLGGCDSLMDYVCTNDCNSHLPTQGACSTQGATAAAGISGVFGANGNGGVGCPAGSTEGTIINGEWIGVAGGSGMDGTHGRGGGGGGASGGVESYASNNCSNDGWSDIGASGGGGGAGGCGATAGQGGTTGGGSFAIFAVFTLGTQGGVPTLTNNEIQRGFGGAGGRGGSGGTGSSGGQGGAGGAGGPANSTLFSVQPGGSGGPGGTGGHGGGGGGGCGGASYGIFAAGQGSTDISAWKNNNTFQPGGGAGNGGSGGGSANGGETGTAGSDGAQDNTNF